MRLDALRIAAKLQSVVKAKGREDYHQTITCHLIKIMMEDEKERLRKEAVSLIELNEYTLSFVIRKSLDISVKVRAAVYKTLKKKNDIRFDQLKYEDKISLVMNGLRDNDSKVIEICKDYLTQSICVKPGEDPYVGLGDEIGPLRLGKTYQPH
jgi:Mg2+ and Co2+ transporter CorA